MRRKNYELLKRMARELEETADKYFESMSDPETSEECLHAFIETAGIFQINVEEVLKDESDNITE